MTTVPKPRPARQPRKPAVRCCRWLRKPTPEAPALVRLSVDGESMDYAFAPFGVSAICGRSGVAFRKPDGETHHVFIGHDGRPVCDCKGFTRWQQCKHAAFAPVLLAALEIPTGVDLADRLCECGQPMVADPDGGEPVCVDCTRWTLEADDGPPNVLPFRGPEPATMPAA